jgi:TonB-linked SusC/RagA family outer membrane protein
MKKNGKQFFRIMKLTFAFILMACLHVSAGGYSQGRISVDFQSVQLKRALSVIEKKSGFRFLYSENLVTAAPRVTLSMSNAEVTEVLNRIFERSGLAYQLMANNLVVLKTMGVELADIRITGKVLSSTGEPVIGASVSIKGSSTGVATDAAGNFAITAPENATLVISSVGFQTQEVAVNNRTTIDVVLQASNMQLDQVVVIGYGTAQKRDLTGSIFTVKSKDIADKPATNALSLLQGKVPGLSIVNSGRPGAEPDVRIRGTNTINGVKPVYIVDGILNDNINFLNPADIESVEVLKDPSSLAIFGVRGANGAIAITTKKARAGQLIVNFNTSVGVKHVQKKIKMTDAAQFKALYAEQLANMGAAPYDFTLWNANTDWQDEIFQDGVINYNNISITGATEKNRFYLGLGYINEEGIIKNEKYKKLTLNFSDELRVTKGLKFGITINAYRAELPDADKGVGSAILAAPIGPVTDPGTGLYHTLPRFQRAQVFNPLVNIEVEKNTRIQREYRAVGSIYGEVDFLRNFNFRVQLYADYGFNTERRYFPIISVYNPDVAGTDKRDSSRKATSVSQKQNVYPKTQMDYLLTFKKKMGDHDITILGGVTTYFRAFEETNSSVQQGTSQVIPNNPDKWYVDQVGDAATRVGSGSAWEDASLSYLARALYSFAGKYLINASFRRDGSSQFYRLDNQWKNFGAVGVGWVISKENFFANQNALDYLKIKGSWGILGNKNIDDKWRYPAYPTLTNANAGVFGDNIIAALQREFIPDPNLNWETVHSYEAGFELNTLGRRLYFEANYYSKKTKDILTVIEGPTGTVPGLGNLGEVKNNGFEFAATWNQHITKDLSLSVGANLTTIKNKVEQLNKTGFAIINGASRTTAGFPIGYFYGYVHDGIYQTNQEIIKSPASTIGVVQPGDIKYRDVDGDGEITPDDRTVIGNPTPNFTYGGSITLNYKGIDLGIDLQGVYGNEIFRAWNQGTFADFNYLEARTDRWHGISTSNWEPILHSGRANNYQNSTYWIEDGSFFRIRNIQLGYTFSKSVLSRARIKSLRIYINAQNLATFTNSTGYTPEIGGSSTSFGVDNGTYPIPAVYSAGLNVNF